MATDMLGDAKMRRDKSDLEYTHQRIALYCLNDHSKDHYF